MKRLVFFLLFAISATATNAQVFGGPGAIWTTRIDLMGQQGIGKSEIIGDTLIQGKLFQKMQYPGGPNVDYIYISGDTVSAIENGQLYTQFIFSANVGDSWICGRESNCYDTLQFDYVPTNVYVTVESKFDTLINGHILRAMWLRKHDDCMANFRPELVIEKAGGITTDILSYKWWITTAQDYGNYDWYKYYGNCYQDNDVGFMHFLNATTPEACGMYLDVKEAPNKAISIYPTPTFNYVYVDGLNNQPFIYALFNATGQLIKAERATGNSIDLSMLTPGLYLLKLTLANGYSQTVKVVKE